jgi:hypothetical protein
VNCLFPVVGHSIFPVPPVNSPFWGRLFDHARSRRRSVDAWLLWANEDSGSLAFLLLFVYAVFAITLYLWPPPVQ